MTIIQDITHARAWELATRMVIQRKKYRETIQELNLSHTQAQQILQSDEYKQIHAQILQQVGAINQSAVEAYAIRMRELVPVAIDGLEKVLDEVAPEKSNYMRAIDSILDRGGLPTVKHVEQAVTVKLDEETLNRIRLTESELASPDDAIDAEWSYAFDKPTPTGGQLIGRNPHGVEKESTREPILYGQVSDRIQGLGPDSPSADVQMDPEAEQEEAGISPSGSS